MSYDNLMNNSIYLTTKTSSQNAYHEWIYTYTTSDTPTPCRMVPVRVADRIDNPGLFDDVIYTCFLKSSAAITRNSQITYHSENYKVKEMEMDSSFHHKKALLIEVP